MPKQPRIRELLNQCEQLRADSEMLIRDSRLLRQELRKLSEEVEALHQLLVAQDAEKECQSIAPSPHRDKVVSTVEHRPS